MKKKLKSRGPAIRCVLCECGGSFKVNPWIVDSWGVLLSLGDKRLWLSEEQLLGFTRFYYLVKSTPVEHYHHIANSYVT